MGHTKFSPDARFGTIKKKLARSECKSIIDLLGTDGIVQKSALNNFEITSKDSYTEEINFQWRDWKSYISNRFNSCAGIREWHVIKILPEGPNISVAEVIGKFFEDYKIVNESALIGEGEEPAIITPDGIGQQRLDSLEYFNKFVKEEHYKYMSTNY